MGFEYNRETENDEKTISFKEALGIISFKKKKVTKIANKTTYKNNIKK